MSEKPSIRSTWAPQGETPVLIHSFNWKRLSLSAALAYRFDGRKSRLVFQAKAGSYETTSLILFLKDLKRHFCGQKVILIWDGLPAHKSAAMNEYINNQKSWLSVERLPGYAPELNPVECLWSNIKGQELANLCVNGFGEIGVAIAAAVKRIKKRRNLLFSFLDHTKLYF